MPIDAEAVGKKGSQPLGRQVFQMQLTDHPRSHQSNRGGIESWMRDAVAEHGPCGVEPIGDADKPDGRPIRSTVFMPLATGARKRASRCGSWVSCGAIREGTERELLETGCGRRELQHATEQIESERDDVVARSQALNHVDAATGIVERVRIDGSGCRIGEGGRRPRDDGRSRVDGDGRDPTPDERCDEDPRMSVQCRPHGH